LTGRRLGVAYHSDDKRVERRLTSVEDKGFDRVALAQAEYVVIVSIRAGSSQHDKIAATAAGAHADKVLIHVIAAALHDDQTVCLALHVRGVAGQEIFIGIAGTGA
jgi:hypothetical protein